MDNKQKITALINEVMSIDVSKFDTQKKLNTISEWDSFNNLMLISRFQEEFSIEFSATELERTDTIAKIYDLVLSKIK